MPETNPIRCGVRPGCIGGLRDGRECKHINDCPGATACVPVDKGCKIEEPCFGCDVVDAQHAVRSCGVCLKCTQEEIDEQAAFPDHVFPFRCCPALDGSPILEPVPPGKKCDNTPGYLSDCAREFDCACRADPCEDEHDVGDIAPDACEPNPGQLLHNNLTYVNEHVTVSANLFCGALGCVGDGTVDYYLINVTDSTLLTVYVPLMNPPPNVAVSTQELTLIDGESQPVLFVALGGPVADGPYLVYTTVLPSLGVFALRFDVPCGESGPACVPYKFHYKTSLPPCPDELCDLPPCLSSIDCDGELSCWSCDHKYGRCIEQANCADDLCLIAGQPNDTCIDSGNGAPCRLCTGDDCVLGQCREGVCTIPEPPPEPVHFDCNCACERICCTATQCPPREGYTRLCDVDTGTCVYRAILESPSPPPGPSSLGAFSASRAGVPMSAHCVQPALDASERGYTAYAMDRFGGFDRTTGARRPALCGGSVEWQHIHIDEPDVLPTDLQAPCCTASTAWHAECLDGAGAGNETGHTWADRAWLMMHHAHLDAQQGRALDAAHKACCASLIWAAIGRACGRTDDAWQLRSASVVRESNGPVMQLWEDGFGDGDTNDFVLFVRTVELRVGGGSELVAQNTHTYPLARGGGFQASYGLAFGASGAFPQHRVDESTACPDRERRLARSVLDQTATRRQLEAMSVTAAATAASSSIVGVLRHVVRSSDNTLPPRVADAECQTVAGAGSPSCPASTQFVALYADTAVALPRERPTLSESLETRVTFREPVVNTQSGTRYWPTRYAASAAYIPARAGGSTSAPRPRFVLRNHDCGISVLLDDTSTTADPLAVTVPASDAGYFRWPAEGMRLGVRRDSTDRTCHGGPLSGSERCTSDAVCGGGYCELPATHIGVPYPYFLDYYECRARGVDCALPGADEHCCSHEVQHWPRYVTRSDELLYEPLND